MSRVASASDELSVSDRQRQRLLTILTLVIPLAALVYDPSALAATPKRALLLLVSTAALALTMPSALRQRAWFSMTGPGALWLLLCGYTVASLSWAKHPEPSDALLWLGTATLLPVLALLRAHQRRALARRCGLLIASGSGVAVAVQRLSGATPSRLHGLHGNPNWLGLVLAVTLPLVLDTLWRWYRASPGNAAQSRARRHQRLALAVIVTGLLLSGLWWSRSRAAWIGLAVAALVVLRGRWRLLALTPVLAAFAAALAMGGIGRAWQGRLWIWRASLAGAVEGLPFGHGAGEQPFVFLPRQAKALAELPTEQASRSFVNATTAHNDWLQLLCEGGLVAPLLLALVLLLAYLKLRQRWAAGSAVVVCVAVGCGGDAALRQPAVAMVLALVLAACPPLPAVRSDRWWGPLSLLLAAVALLPSSRRWLAERSLAQVQAQALDAQLPALQRVVTIDPSFGLGWLRLGLAQLQRRLPEDALESLAQSRRRLANPGTAIAQGNARMQLQQPRRALRFYARALAEQPASFRAHVNAAEACRQLGQLDQAAAHLDVAAELQPNHPKLLRLAERLRVDQADAATR